MQILILTMCTMFIVVSIDMIVQAYKEYKLVMMRVSELEVLLDILIEENTRLEKEVDQLKDTQ